MSRTGARPLRQLSLLPLWVSVVAAAGLVAAPGASAWSWPLGGALLRPYVNGTNPYAAGQHRGVDVAGAADEIVRAPAAGVVSFAGSVAANGLTLTIQTTDGFAVTLTHLGALHVSRGAAVAEGEAVGVAGPSGEPEWPQPYVHLGVRAASDPDGYRDPLELLPVREVAQPPPVPAESPPAVPVPAAASSSQPVPATAPTAPPPVPSVQVGAPTGTHGASSGALGPGRGADRRARRVGRCSGQHGDDSAAGRHP